MTPRNDQEPGTAEQDQYSYLTVVWPLLDSAERSWILESPGLRALPRNITNHCLSRGGTEPTSDQDGLTALTENDLAFLRSQRRALINRAAPLHLTTSRGKAV